MPHSTLPGVIELLDLPGVRATRDYILATDERTLRDQVELTEIPAPPFGEEARGQRLAELLEEAGLVEVRTDEIGNVVGVRHGRETGAPLVLAAHLDTVFPAGTDLKVGIEDGVLRAPGISDDGRGLAALLAVARALSETGVTTRRPILFVGTVGEEGNGDLRGVKHLFRDGGPAHDACAFISLDGAGIRTVVNRGLGARRFRVVVRGRGGHSWVDRGMSNPIHALGRAIGALASWPPPSQPAVSLTISRFGGGTSVNTIPVEAWAELDVRSESERHLEVAEERVRAALNRSVDEENSGATDDSQRIDLQITLIGVRPPGATDADSPLVEAALTVSRILEVEASLVSSSTDANLPMSLGIPAITLGAGGEAGGAHTLEEWYRNTRGPEGVCRALYTVLLVAGVS
jgi:acetylornithine deacetylase/succinyl-diaminopimelate desuccinylase-like protein